jgi:hypothetical protein
MAEQEIVSVKEHLEAALKALEKRFDDHKTSTIEATRLLATSTATAQQLLAEAVKVNAADVEKRLQRVTNAAIGLLAIAATLLAAFILKK